MASFTSAFEPFALAASNQRMLGAPHAADTVTPLALRPRGETSLDQAVSTIQLLQQDGELTAKLAKHGTLLFRDLPIQSASDFSRFAHAFGYKPHEIIGIVVDRPELAPNVAPANESPPHVLIYNHNESPQVPHAPEYIFFYAHKTPPAGGETPISSSVELFHRTKEQFPEFITALADKGVRSTVTYRTGAQYKGGSTLRQAFGKTVLDTDDDATQRQKMEAQLARYARGQYTTWEWDTDSDGEVLTVTHILPAIRRQQGTSLPTLFTGLAAYYKNAQVNGARANPTQQLYGDGTPIPEKYLKGLADITDEIRVLHKWERGDVLVYDNVVSQHGRQPWLGEQADRVVLASLFDGEVPGSFGDAGWAQVVQAVG